MKRRILFVDDDPLVLAGLRRLMHALREQWETEFAQSGAEALECLAARPFDAVVSDMKMPSMNGAALLEEVMRRHPATARLVLSGHADADLMSRCVGIVHQCLSKPCEPEMLWQTLGRATAWSPSSDTEDVRRLVTSLHRLPTIPAIYCEMVEVLRQPDAGLDAVAILVERDPGLTARLLQLVNSAFFGLSRSVTSPQEAVTYLGLDTLRSLVLSMQTFAQFDDGEHGGLSVHDVWEHSVRVAQRAKQLARAVGAARELTEAAFVGGLLHDVGRIVLASSRAVDYALVGPAAAERGATWTKIERERFGCSHADVGGYLLGLWGLPCPVVDAITFHHEPGRSRDLAFSPLTAVHIANALDEDAIAREGSAGGRPLLDGHYLAALGLPADAEAWRVTSGEDPGL